MKVKRVIATRRPKVSDKAVFTEQEAIVVGEKVIRLASVDVYVFPIPVAVLVDRYARRSLRGDFSRERLFVSPVWENFGFPPVGVLYAVPNRMLRSKIHKLVSMFRGLERMFPEVDREVGRELGDMFRRRERDFPGLERIFTRLGWMFPRMDLERRFLNLESMFAERMMLIFVILRDGNLVGLDLQVTECPILLALPRLLFHMLGQILAFQRRAADLLLGKEAPEATEHITGPFEQGR